MTEKQFNVIVTEENNDVEFDTTMKSLKNGFIELWLPGDKKYTLSVVFDSKSNSIQVGTFESSNTCITTLQLK